MDDMKLKYEKAEMEIIDLSDAENIFTASGGDICMYGGDNSGGDNDG